MVCARFKSENGEIGWDERTGLRTGRGVRSQVIDVLEAQIKNETGMELREKISAVAAKTTKQMDGQGSNLKIWGGRRESNPQRPEPQSGALPVELLPPYPDDYSNRGQQWLAKWPVVVELIWEEGLEA